MLSSFPIRKIDSVKLNIRYFPSALSFFLFSSFFLLIVSLLRGHSKKFLWHWVEEQLGENYKSLEEEGYYGLLPVFLWVKVFPTKGSFKETITPPLRHGLCIHQGLFSFLQLSHAEKVVLVLGNSYVSLATPCRISH